MLSLCDENEEPRVFLVGSKDDASRGPAVYDKDNWTSKRQKVRLTANFSQMRIKMNETVKQYIEKHMKDMGMIKLKGKQNEFL